MRLEFLIVDPQIDFCDKNIGSLYVNGADGDVARLAKCLERLRDKIDDIHVTLDCHHLLDVAHPLFWLDENGNHPAPFTMISSSDVKNGVWKPFNPIYVRRMISYTETLRNKGRYVLTIWPPHCRIGTPGSNIVPEISKELDLWCENKCSQIDYITKGFNIWTEHYSAVQAEVPDPLDPSTQLNIRLIRDLKKADIIVISGWALSHCLANTLHDIANNFGDDSIKKMVLLIDTTSSVPGFEALGEDFVDEMMSRGMQIAKSDDFFI